MKRPKNGRRTQLIGTLSIGKREVKYLQPYYKQGGRWYKLNSKRGK